MLLFWFLLWAKLNLININSLVLYLMQHLTFSFDICCTFFSFLFIHFQFCFYLFISLHILVHQLLSLESYICVKSPSVSYKFHQPRFFVLPSLLSGEPMKNRCHLADIGNKTRGNWSLYSANNFRFFLLLICQSNSLFAIGLFISHAQKVYLQGSVDICFILIKPPAKQLSVVIYIYIYIIR